MIDPFPFGRPRDDRGSLLVAAIVAVALHALAIFIPLPDMPAAEAAVPVRPPGPDVRIYNPVPPQLPDRPPEYVPAINTIAVPFDVPEAPELRVDEPDTPCEDSFEAVDGMPDWTPGEVDRPAPVGVIDEYAADLVLPVLIDKPSPEFPHQATWNRLSGLVILQAVIDREGNVIDIEVLDVTRPDLGYSASAIEAVSRWRYRPGKLHGRPVAVRLTVQVEFSVN